MIILCDSREQKPFMFSMSGVETKRCKIDTGDYTIEGFENIIGIDRKFGISELYENCFGGYARFKKELIRSQIFRAFYFICEFPYSHVLNFPANMPRGNYRFNAGHIVDKIKHIEEKYGAKFIFCENREHAEETCFNILKDYYEKHNE